MKPDKKQNDDVRETDAGVNSEIGRSIDYLPPTGDIIRHMDLLDQVTRSTRAHLAYLDRNFNFVWVNDTYAHGCAHTKEELIGHNHFEYFPHEENQAIFKRVRDTGIAYEAIEKPFIYPEHPEWGVTYWNWTLTPVKDASGVVQGLAFSLFDVTENVKTRQEIEKKNRQLEDLASQLAATNEELSLANKKLYASNRSLKREIEEKKRVEEELQSVALFPQENPYPVLRVSASGEVLFANAPAIEMLSEHSECHFAPPELKEPAILALKTESSLEVETRHRGRIFSFTIAPIKDRGYANLYGRDITASRHMEESLRLSTERLAILSDMAAQLLVSDAPEHLIGKLCRRIMEHLDCQVFLNYWLDEADGRFRLNAYAGVPPETAERIEWMDTEQGFCCCGLVARDGERIVLGNEQIADHPCSDLIRSLGLRAYACHPIMDSEGKTLGTISFGSFSRTAFSEDDLAMMKIASDQISTALQRIRLLEAEQQRAAELESLFTGIPDGVALLNRQGQIIFINEAGRRIIGIPEGQSYGDHRSGYQGFELSGEPIDVEHSPVSRALRGETVRDMRMRLLTPWGKELILATSAAPILDGQGNIIGATTIFRDIREQVEFERRREELLQREQRIADMLQKALIPEAAYEIPGCVIAARYEPALREAEVGGDFHDVFEIQDGKIGFLIGDVAGKGLLAAVRVAAAKHTIRSYAYIDPQPARVLTLANEALSREPAEYGTFLTAFFAVLDLASGTISYANGGHEPPFVRNASGNIEELAVPGCAIGVFRNYEYSEGRRMLEPGEMVVMVTDGITEARDGSGNLFGKQGVEECLLSAENPTPEAIASSLLDRAGRHAGANLQDDAAILVFSLGNSASQTQETRREWASGSGEGGIAITISRAGALDRSNVAPFRNDLQEAVSSAKEVTIDLRFCRFIDSSILECIGQAAMTAQDRAVGLKLRVSESSLPLYLLQTAGFGDLVEIRAETVSLDEEPWTARKEIMIELGEDISQLASCRNAARDVAITAGFEGEAVWGIMSAVFEACANAMTHGRRAKGRPITVTMHAYADRFEAVVHNKSDSFVCPAEAPMPPPTAPRGRGIPLIKAFMDEVRSDSSSGCKMTLIKYLRH